MQYVTSVERMAIARGFEKGMEQGILESERKTLRRLLLRRFQVIPDWAEDRILHGAELSLNNG